MTGVSHQYLARTTLSSIRLYHECQSFFILINMILRCAYIILFTINYALALFLFLFDIFLFSNHTFQHLIFYLFVIEPILYVLRCLISVRSLSFFLFFHWFSGMHVIFYLLSQSQNIISCASSLYPFTCSFISTFLSWISFVWWDVHLGLSL
jgi:hypothetical protein